MTPEVIARYGAFARPPATPAPDAAGRELAELLAFRKRLVSEITARQPGSSNSDISKRPCSGGARKPISPASSLCSPACRGST